MLPWSADLAGRIDKHVLSSELLRGNPLGDPHERPLWVQLPAGYDNDPGRRYPSVYVLQGYTGHVTMWANRAGYQQPFPELADALFASGQAPAAIVVYVDAWTAYGGSQFVDSPGTGRYHSYLCNEVVPWVDARYRTLADRAHRGVTGKSSGGFGAMITPMLRPDLFGALATHAGDSLYELCYMPGFGAAVRYLRGYDGDIMGWWKDFQARSGVPKDGDNDLLMLLGVSACFSARADGVPQLPMDPLTGVLRPQVWQRWLDWDPVRMHACWYRLPVSDVTRLDGRADRGVTPAGPAVDVACGHARRSAQVVELAVLDPRDKSAPLVLGERQHRTVWVLGVAHQDQPASVRLVRGNGGCVVGDRHLDGFVVRGAVAAFTPPIAGEIHSVYLRFLWLGHSRWRLACLAAACPPGYECVRSRLRHRW